MSLTSHHFADGACPVVVHYPGERIVADSDCPHTHQSLVHGVGYYCDACRARVVVDAPRRRRAGGVVVTDCLHELIHRLADGYFCTDCQLPMRVVPEAPPCTGLADLAASDNA